MSSDIYSENDTLTLEELREFRQDSIVKSASVQPETVARVLLNTLVSYGDGWRGKAACVVRDGDGYPFFPRGSSEPKGQRLGRESYAKSICGSCAVRSECLDYAITSGQDFGIWGGMTEVERKVYRKTYLS